MCSLGLRVACGMTVSTEHAFSYIVNRVRYISCVLFFCFRNMGRIGAVCLESLALVHFAGTGTWREVHRYPVKLQGKAPPMGASMR